MRESELKAIEERCNAATEGPWVCRSFDITSRSIRREIVHRDHYHPVINPVCVITEGFVKSEANAHFLATVKQDVESLIAEVHRLRTENKRLDQSASRIYHQRDEWKKRAEHPKSAWSAYVDGANAMVFRIAELQRQLEVAEKLCKEIENFHMRFGIDDEETELHEALEAWQKQKEKS